MLLLLVSRVGLTLVGESDDDDQISFIFWIRSELSMRVVVSLNQPIASQSDNERCGSFRETSQQERERERETSSVALFLSLFSFAFVHKHQVLVVALLDRLKEDKNGRQTIKYHWRAFGEREMKRRTRKYVPSNCLSVETVQVWTA